MDIFRKRQITSRIELLAVDANDGYHAPAGVPKTPHCDSNKPINVINSANILVVDDDMRIRELLRTSLEAEGFTVQEAGTSEELYNCMNTEVIDLITMDVLLDRENGLDLIRDIRRMSDIPIILISGRVELIDTVVGLEIGADDYITKPFPVRELIARVRSVLRRAKIRTGAFPNKEKQDSLSENTMEVVRFGDWVLIPAARELRDPDNQTVNLTTTEYDLLDIFVSSPQRVLSRDQIMEQLTGRDWQPNDRVIDNHVAQLRKKIESDNGFEWIKTVRGTGYMFAGKTTRGILQI